MEKTTPTPLQDQDDFLEELMAIPLVPVSVSPQEDGVPLAPLEESLASMETIEASISQLPGQQLSKPDQGFQVEEMEPSRQSIPRVLQRWEGLGKPVPSVVCVRCQASMWINRSDKTLENYCRAMHLITWSTGEPEDLKDCQGLEMSQ